MSIADRIAIMRDGAIVQIGPPSEIYNAPANRFVAEIVGSPRINLFEGHVSGGSFQADDLPLQLPFDSLPEGPAALAIRPEDLEILDPAAAPNLVAAEIYEVEPLGGHTVVDVSVGEVILRAHLPGQPDYRPGEAVGLRIDRNHCHLFDGRSGDVLVHAH